MRLAVLSDIHGNYTALETVLGDMARRAPDGVVVLGDLVVKGPHPAQCVAAVRHLDPLALVRGNYDHLFRPGFPPSGWRPTTPKMAMGYRAYLYTYRHLDEADRAYVSGLPTHRTLQVAGHQVELFHATPTSLGANVWPWASDQELDGLCRDPESSLVLCGHIHYAYQRRVGARWVINPGSVGLPYDRDPRAAYALVDLAPGQVEVELVRVEYDVEAAVRAAAGQDMPDWEIFAETVRRGEYPFADEP